MRMVKELVVVTKVLLWSAVWSCGWVVFCYMARSLMLYLLSHGWEWS